MDVVISCGEKKKRIIFHASTAQHMQLIKLKRMSLPLAVAEKLHGCAKSSH